MTTTELIALGRAYVLNPAAMVIQTHVQELELISRLTDALEEHTRTMTARELHHFETEQENATLKELLATAQDDERKRIYDEVRLMPCYGPSPDKMEFDVGEYARTQVLGVINAPRE